MKNVSTSAEPRRAPGNFRQLPAKVVTSDGDGLWQTWHGSGVPSGQPCAGCGNADGNRKVYHNWGHSYPNGNSWDDQEILCGACGCFTLVNEFTEG